MRPWIVVLALLSLAGCATSAKYEAVLDRWVGKHVDELVKGWGPPRTTFALSDGGNVHQWETGGVHSSGGWPVYSRHGHIRGYSPTYVRSYVCRTDFIVGADKIVKSWRWEGNACVAR